MKTNEFIKQLRATAEELKPLTKSVNAGGLVWDGTQYAKSDESKSIEPYAFAWWFTLTSISELIEKQESPLTAKQLAYLSDLLFGGMGSLNDLTFDKKALGPIAEQINNNLGKRRQALFSSFKAMQI